MLLSKFVSAFPPAGAISITEENPQLIVCRILLVNVINMKHELAETAQQINCKSVERELAPYSSDMGRPAVPVRKMAGGSLLKLMYGLPCRASIDSWIEIPCIQYSCGETCSQLEKPFDPDCHLSCPDLPAGFWPRKYPLIDYLSF
jgi:IS5 family transposase